jgi:putative selenate reductase
MRREVELCGAVFDLPRRNWFVPRKEFDFSARHCSGIASTPAGPAAGPHTQLAQNIVLSWLAGGRILELKTVQVNDHLQIPRPCIYIPNVGYNVEWSQELTISESLREYAKAVYLIEILKKTAAFHAFQDPEAFRGSSATVFDASVGYDLDGIRSEKVTGFLRSLRNPAKVFDELRTELSGDLREFRDIELPPLISDCVTLSTFHGCPAREIEAIVRFLLEDLGFHAVVKFNPTLLGFDAVRELLFDRLGYRYLKLLPEAFEQDLQYDDAVAMLHRLRACAQRCGRDVGAKFTNTLVVENDPCFFPQQSEPYMYLSGQPLHVIAMTLMQRFREDLQFDPMISFSAGIDRHNFADAVACGMVPVTTCTDLLRQGGYGRLPKYLTKLADAMRASSVTTLEAFVLAARGHAAQAIEQALKAESGGARLWERDGARLVSFARERPNDLPGELRVLARAAGLDADAVVLRATRIAGRLNGRDIVPALADNPKYCADLNRAEPHRVDRALGLYDCINCDLCISACPNDAVFAYTTTPVRVATEVFRWGPGREAERAPGAGFVIGKAHQLGIVQSLCNECSNCDVYCPEHGAPYKVKERVFLNLESFHSRPLLDGFCRQNTTLFARLGGKEFRLIHKPGQNSAIIFGARFEMEVQWEPFAVKQMRHGSSEGFSLDTALLWRMKTAWESIFRSEKPNMVNPGPVRHSAGFVEAGR